MQAQFDVEFRKDGSIHDAGAGRSAARRARRSDRLSSSRTAGTTTRRRPRRSTTRLLSNVERSRTRRSTRAAGTRARRGPRVLAQQEVRGRGPDSRRRRGSVDGGERRRAGHMCWRRSSDDPVRLGDARTIPAAVHVDRATRLVPALDESPQARREFVAGSSAPRSRRHARRGCSAEFFAEDPTSCSTLGPRRRCAGRADIRRRGVARRRRRGRVRRRRARRRPGRRAAGSRTSRPITR